ncbi:MAG: hypothetical protein V3V09_08000 [Arenicellales bacterium]
MPQLNNTPKLVNLPLLAISTVLAFSLSACDDLKEYTSSDAGQEFVRYSPEVKSSPAVQSNNVINIDGGSSSNTSNTSSTGSTTTANTADSSNPKSEPTSTELKAPSLASTGIVWKPISEGNHKLVVLTPTSYGSPSVAILNASGKIVENGHYVGHTNGNRATYRFSRAGGGYSAPAFLKVGSAVYLVSSPASRYN